MEKIICTLTSHLMSSPTFPHFEMLLFYAFFIASFFSPSPYSLPPCTSEPPFQLPFFRFPFQHPLFLFLRLHFLFFYLVFVYESTCMHGKKRDNCGLRSVLVLLEVDRWLGTEVKERSLCWLQMWSSSCLIQCCRKKKKEQECVF